MEDSRTHFRYLEPGSEHARSRPRNPGEAPQGKGPSNSSVAHTLTACCRCRMRKTRCDPSLPRCSPCQRNNATCEYLDTLKGKKINRAYVVHLQNRVQKLEDALAQLRVEPKGIPDTETMARSAGYVRFKGRDEPRYLGPSSGIAITRLVMELAKRNNATRSIRDIVPITMAHKIKDYFSQEEDKPTSKVYPLISDVAAPYLPTRELTDSLVETFNHKAQFLLPTLHEPTFKGVVEDVYSGSKDPYQNFTLRMVIAISMQKLDTQYAGLADSYYLAALPYLEASIKPMDLSTLQCFALMAHYSLVTPTRTAAYWIVGLASRLSQELGLNDEAKISPVHAHGPQYNPLEIDMRRRLFWIITSMEFGLAHSLGRPSCGTTFDHIDVAFFETVDDQYVHPTGVLPGSPQSPKKLIAIHFFRMRLLQAQIRRKLYLKKRPEPKTDKDPWVLVMDAKLKDWLSQCPKDDKGSGLSELWFKARYNTMLILLYRPSPQIPEPSVEAAQKCFEAAVFNIQVQREQITSKSVDVTWIFTQSLFMVLNTLLWTVSYVEIRAEHPREEVENSIDMARTGVYLTSYHWPGVKSALELYEHLIGARLRTFDGSEDSPQVTSSVSYQTSPASSHEIVTPPPLVSPFDRTVLHPSPQNIHLAPRSSPSNYGFDQDQQHVRKPSPTPSDYNLSESYMSSSVPSVTSPNFRLNTGYGNENALFDPSSIYNTFPLTNYPEIHHDLDQDFASYLVPMGKQYSQYLHAPYAQDPFQSLSQGQQMELMSVLESTGVKL